MSKLTPWFKGVVKPKRVGVYLRDDSGLDVIKTRRSYSYFDGWNWCVLCADMEQANRCRIISTFQEIPWCGLAKEPA